MLTCLKNILYITRNKTSAACDIISSRILQALPTKLVNIFFDAINHSFFTANLSTYLKNAVIVPLHKRGNTNDLIHDNLIALLPTLNKVVDKLIKSRIMSYLIKHNSDFSARGK